MSSPLLIVLLSPTDTIQDIISTGGMCMALRVEGEQRDCCSAYLAEKQGNTVMHRVFFDGLSVQDAHKVLAEMLTDWADAFDQQHVIKALREVAESAEAPAPYNVASPKAAPVDRSKMN